MQSEKEKKNELTVKYNGGSGAVILYMKCEEVTEAPILDLTGWSIPSGWLWWRPNKIVIVHLPFLHNWSKQLITPLCDVIVMQRECYITARRWKVDRTFRHSCRVLMIVWRHSFVCFFIIAHGLDPNEWERHAGTLHPRWRHHVVSSQWRRRFGSCWFLTLRKEGGSGRVGACAVVASVVGRDRAGLDQVSAKEGGGDWCL